MGDDLERGEIGGEELCLGAFWKSPDENLLGPVL